MSRLKTELLDRRIDQRAVGQMRRVERPSIQAHSRPDAHTQSLRTRKSVVRAASGEPGVGDSW